MRAPRHAFGGPEPAGTGTGLLRWQRDASALLYDHMKAEREKEWKRERFRLVIKEQQEPVDVGALGPERAAAIERERERVKFRKFWDLMHEQDRPWHYDIVRHLCTELSPYSCKAYMAVSAGTMQRILAQRAQGEKAVHEQREAATRLRYGLAGAARRMRRSGRPLSLERLQQLKRLTAQVEAGVGLAKVLLRGLQKAARATYQDAEYEQHVESLLPLLRETRRVAVEARRQLLPELRSLRAELQGFQQAFTERRLARDQALGFLAALRSRDLACEAAAAETVGWRYGDEEGEEGEGELWEAGVDGGEGGEGGEGEEGESEEGEEEEEEEEEAGTRGSVRAWQALTPDEEVAWRYPPLEWWREQVRRRKREGARMRWGRGAGGEDGEDGAGGAGGGGAGRAGAGDVGEMGVMLGSFGAAGGWGGRGGAEGGGVGGGEGSREVQPGTNGAGAGGASGGRSGGERPAGASGGSLGYGHGGNTERGEMEGGRGGQAAPLAGLFD
ncbi:hypothetical protein HYH03_007769 [Edaphochlamys debaryana]|uniref:Uncharacterized protein n=1 Tax=Edaphochlamys debaryana TaxID=47281 RepID=A0A835Y1D5_9CHLO|nr:hypothetical protein HYH03_007769 [Edaphochlamys debaryana]|eukprot:KAG2494131.1 hypothetical protein HYH03_007769 [Edaphochlamys debaryana]